MSDSTEMRWVPIFDLKAEDLPEGTALLFREGDRVYDVVVGARIPPTHEDGDWTIELTQPGVELPALTLDPRPNHSAWDDVAVGDELPVYDEDGNRLGTLVRADDETFALADDRFGA